MAAEKRFATVEIDLSVCKGCGMCIENCPPKVLSFSTEFNTLGYQYAQYSGQNCTGCEACFYACPEPGAITVIKEMKQKAPETEASK